MKRLAKNIRERRLQMGMSQEELAKCLGVSKTTVSNYERNITDPSPDVMERLSEALDVSISYFFMHSPDMAEIPAELIIGGLDLVTDASLNDDGEMTLSVIRQGENIKLLYSEYDSMYFRVCSKNNGVSEYILMHNTNKLPEEHGVIYACINGAGAQVYYYMKSGVMHILSRDSKNHKIKDINNICILGVMCEPDWE